MTKLEMVQDALQATGSASPEAIAAFVERKFGVTIEAQYIPIFRASLLGREMVVTRKKTTTEAMTPA